MFIPDILALWYTVISIFAPNNYFIFVLNSSVFIVNSKALTVFCIVYLFKTSSYITVKLGSAVYNFTYNFTLNDSML